MKTTLGQLLVNEALPPDMVDYDRVLDKKGINNLLLDLAKRHPERYAEVSKKLNDIGRTVATEFGGYSFGLRHMGKSDAGARYQGEIKNKMRQILANPNLTSEQRKNLIIKTVGAMQQKQIDEIYKESIEKNNPLALQVLSGSRGNRMNLASLLGSDMLYSDHRDQVIPLPITSSYSQGLKPVEYWAATYGARRGTLATKFATADAGFLSKQLNQIAHRLNVVGDDDTRDIPNRGLPVDTDDDDNEGALLAKDFGPYKRNTVLTPKIIKHLRSLGHERLLVRSPIVGGSPDGGVYARDVGVREHGVLPGRGEQVGLTAAQALSEPLSQGQLSAKHSGGVAGQEKAVGGFAYINQLVQVPKKFKGGAAVSEQDGIVNKIEPAPAGGNYVWINGHKHFTPINAEVKVKLGDKIEAGDVLSEGIPNPADIVRHKGIGEGKRYFVNAFRTAMTDAGLRVNRRNVELLARGLINHVRMNDEHGDNIPDDVVSYSSLEHRYEPRDGHIVGAPDKAMGQYLERPVLHYSIGTKIRPSVLKELQHFGVDKVVTHNEPPPFEPEMVRGMYSLQHDPDWMTRMYGSGLKTSLLDSVHHGGVSDEKGTSFVPSLARAVDFGRMGGAIHTPERGTPLPPEGTPLPDLPKPTLNKPKSFTISPPAKKGLLSGLFKTSGQDKEAEIKIQKNVIPIKSISLALPIKSIYQIKMADDPAIKEPHVDTAPKAPTTDQSQSSTGTLPKPAMPAPPATPATPQPAAQPQAPQTSTPTASHTPSAPPGQIHPSRVTPNFGQLDLRHFATLTQGPKTQPQLDHADLPHSDLIGGDPTADIKPVPSMPAITPPAAMSAPTPAPVVTPHVPTPSTTPIQPVAQPVVQPPMQSVPSPVQPGLNLNTAGRVISSPLTSPVVSKAVEPVGKIVARQVFKEAEKDAAKLAMKGAQNMGLKVIMKKVPYVGWAMEVYDAADTPTEELRAKFNDKINNTEATPSGLGMYLLDNALNPGQNVRAGGIALRDAQKMYQQVSDPEYNGDANDVAHKTAFLGYLEAAKARRGLQPEEQAKLEQLKNEIASAGNAHKSNLLDKTLNTVAGTKLPESRFREAVELKSGRASDVAYRARLSIGQNMADKVLSGKASPFETDCFHEWLDSVAGPESLGNVGLSPPTEVSNMQADKDVMMLTDLAVRAGNANNKEIAEKAMMQVDRIGQNAAIRKQRWDEAMAKVKPVAPLSGMSFGTQNIYSPSLLFPKQQPTPTE